MSHFSFIKMIISTSYKRKLFFWVPDFSSYNQAVVYGCRRTAVVLRVEELYRGYEIRLYLDHIFADSTLSQLTNSFDTKWCCFTEF